MKVPHTVGHVKCPASPFATHGVDVKDLGLGEIALDLDPQNLLGSGDELRDRCYLGPRHAVREHAPLNQHALHPGRHRLASHRAVCVYWYASDVCIRVCHQRKFGRLYSKFEIAAAGLAHWEALRKCCDLSFSARACLRMSAVRFATGSHESTDLLPLELISRLPR